MAEEQAFHCALTPLTHATEVLLGKRGLHGTFELSRLKGTRTLASGARVPMGKGGPNEYLESNLERLKEAEGARAPGLMYNEFIVYDTAQIEMKYVVVFDMDFSIELD